MRNPQRRRPTIPAWVGLLLLVSGVLALGGSAFLAQAGSLQQTAQEGEAIFQQKCASCHTIGGGRLVGPDLEGVTARRDMQWLAEFIARPDQMIASGDPTAKALLEENNNIPMPNLGLGEAEVQALLAYLEAGSGAAAPPAGEQAAALPEGAVASGAAIFSGERRLANGGPSCIACHSVSSLGRWGGGTLGPDLTFVFRRYGEAGLSSALQTLPFPTMQGAFANRPLTAQEVADLYAYFEWANSNAPDPRPAATTEFFLLGLGGMLALFAVLAVFWPRQRQRPAVALRQKTRLAARR